MKNLLVFLFMLSITPTIAQGPPPKMPEQRKEKIEAMRNAYLTSQMNLTPEEAQKFWPIYNEFRAEMQKLEKPLLANPANTDQMSEEEAKQLIYKELERENQRYLIQKKYAERFLAVISAKKIIKMRFAEREFKRILIEELSNKKPK